MPVSYHFSMNSFDIKLHTAFSALASKYKLSRFKICLVVVCSQFPTSFYLRWHLSAFSKFILFHVDNQHDCALV